jgi:putative flippase GtrA
MPNLMALVLEKYLSRTNTFIRFLLIGIVNTCVGISVILTLLNVVGFSYWLSTLLGNCIGAIVSYVLNKKFTFKSTVKNRKGVPIFALVIIGSYLISYQLGYKLIHDYKVIDFGLYKEELSVLLATVIYAILNYLGQRFLTFKY